MRKIRKSYINNLKPFGVQATILKAMKRKHFGSDFDIDTQRNELTTAVNKAFITYWDSEFRVIQETVMWPETIFPITILEAIRVFAPEFAAGCNVTFQLVDGSLTKLNVIEF